MMFPTHIKTKRQAIQLADALFPDLGVAVGRVREAFPADSHDERVRSMHRNPFSCVRMDMETTLKQFLYWLYDEDGKMRVYKRPRYWLMEIVVRNYNRLEDQRREAQDRFYHHEWYLESRGKESLTNQYQDGGGI